MGEKHLGNQYNLGKKRAEESKMKMSESHKGKDTWKIYPVTGKRIWIEKE